VCDTTACVWSNKYCSVDNVNSVVVSGCYAVSYINTVDNVETASKYVSRKSKIYNVCKLYR
jgi:hypothetical protein